MLLDWAQDGYLPVPPLHISRKWGPKHSVVWAGQAVMQSGGCEMCNWLSQVQRNPAPLGWLEGGWISQVGGMDCSIDQSLLVSPPFFSLPLCLTDFGLGHVICVGHWNVSRYDKNRSFKCVPVVLPSYSLFTHKKDMPQVTLTPSAWFPKHTFWNSFVWDGYSLYEQRCVWLGASGSNLGWKSILEGSTDAQRASFERNELTEVWV